MLTAQIPVLKLDFEGVELPAGVVAVDGATSVDTTNGQNALLDFLKTEPVSLDKKNGSQSLQMANSGYLSFDESLINKNSYSISFWIKWVDVGSGNGEEPDDGVISYAGLVDLKGTIDGKDTLVHLVDAQNSEKLRLYSNGKDSVGFEDKDKNRLWTNITLTSNASEVALYANGIELNRRPHAEAFVSMKNVQLILGAKLTDGTMEPRYRSKDMDTLRFFGVCGYIDDVKIFDEALSPGEVMFNYKDMVVGDNSVFVNINDYKQQYIGSGGSFGLYLGNFLSMPEESRMKAMRMLAEDIHLNFVKYYVGDYPYAEPERYDNIATFVRYAKRFNPNVKVQICANNLPDHLEKGGATDKNKKGEHNPNIEGIMDSIANYYFQVLQGLHDRGVAVEELDLINEEGLSSDEVDLFDIAVDKLEEILADPDKNPDNLKRPLIVGPSSWSVKTALKFIEEFKNKRRNAWDNLDIVSTHGYQKGTYENYKAVFDAAEGKPFYNNEQTGKIQDDEGTGVSAIDDLARQFVQGEEPDHVCDVSIAMRMSDVINAGGNSFFIFQLNNSSGNRAALIRTTKSGIVEKSLVYDGFKQISSTQPDSSHRVSRMTNGLDNMRVVTFRKKGEDTVYVHATNVWGNNEPFNITLSSNGVDTLGIKAVYGWVNDEYREGVQTISEEYESSHNTFAFTATPHSVNSFKIVIDPDGYDVKLKEQVVTFEALTNKIQGDVPFDLTAASTSGLPVELKVLSGSASVEGKTLTLTGGGKVVIAAVQPGNDEYMASNTVIRAFEVEPVVVSVSGENNARSVLLTQTVQMDFSVLPTEAIYKDPVWKVKDSTGSATISETGLLTPDKSGIVVVGVSVTLSDGSKVEGSVEVSIDEASSMLTLSGEHVRIYPNPASDFFTVEPEEDGVFELINIFGQIVRVQKVRGGQPARINIAGLPSGQYVVKVTGEDMFVKGIVIN